MNPENMVTGAAVGGLVGAANAGHFAVDIAAGMAMTNSIGEMRDQVGEALKEMQALEQRAQLGDMPEAVAIARLNTQVANSDTQSLYAALHQFYQVLGDAENAVRRGMQNYADVEQNNTQGQGRVLEA